MRGTLMESTQIWYEVSIKMPCRPRLKFIVPPTSTCPATPRWGRLVAANVHFYRQRPDRHFAGEGGPGFLLGETQENPGKGDHEEPKLGGYPIGTPEPDEGGGAQP